MTELMVNVSSARAARDAAALPVAGVGLMRSEFLFYGLGRHPQALLTDGQESRLLDVLVSGMVEVARAFHPRPVVYRTLDFKSNEMRSLDGGEDAEPSEDNPCLGLRGCSRYREDPEIFLLELKALRMAREAGLENLQLMLPFVRVPTEVHDCRLLMGKAGLEDIPLWAMAEVPAFLFFIHEISPVIDGISVGTNDLTQLLFGVDRDNPRLGHLYDDGHPVVLNVVRTIIDSAKRRGLRTSVCGDRPSTDECFVRSLLEVGVDSISVPPSAVRTVARWFEDARTGTGTG